MPIIREYDQQLRAPNQPISQSADPMAAGAGFRGMAELGKGIRDVGKAIFDAAEQNELATYQVESAKVRADLNAKRKRAKETGEAADPEYVRYATEAAEEAAAKLADDMTTKRGHEAARVSGAGLVSDVQVLAVQDNAFAVGAHAKQAAQETLAIDGNTLLGSPEFFGALMQKTNEYWDGPGGAHVDAPVREQIKRESTQQLAVFAVNGTILSDAPLAQRQLISGAWDKYLPPEQKLALINRAEAKVAEDKGRANLVALLRLQEQADNGTLTEKQTIAAFEAKIFQSAPQAMAFYARSKERAKEIERQRQLDVAINLGDPLPLVKYSPKEQQEGFDRFAGKSVLAAGDDPDLQMGAVNQIVARGRELGLIPSQMKAKLESATVARPAQFVDAAKWYDGLRVVDPTYANAHVRPEQAALFNVYLAAKAGGQQDAQAVEIVRQAGDPEKLRKFRKELDSDTLKAINRAAADHSYFPWNAEVTNASWAANSIAELTKMRMAFGDSNAQEATKWATDQFKARHVKVGGRWLPLQGAASPDLAPALEEYLKRLPDAMKKHGAEQEDIDPEGYELRTDRQTAIDGSLQAYSNSSGMALPGYRVTPQGALQAFDGLKRSKAAAETRAAAGRLKQMRDAERADEGAEFPN